MKRRTFQKTRELCFDHHIHHWFVTFITPTPNPLLGGLRKTRSPIPEPRKPFWETIPGARGSAIGTSGATVQRAQASLAVPES